MRNRIIIELSVLCLLGGLWLGFYLQPELQVVTIERIITQTEYVDVEVKVPYEITHYIDVPVVEWRQIYPRQFDSVEQFEAWYLEQGFSLLWNKDCNDYARKLQTTALKQGYSISQALVWNGKYYRGIKVSNISLGHTGNLVLINNTYYWIEPQPNKFEVIEICRRD